MAILCLSVGKKVKARKKLIMKFSNSIPPVIKFVIGTGHGYPHFTVVFESESDLDQAEENGLCAQIQTEIEQYVGMKDFDPKVGVYHTTSAKHDEFERMMKNKGI